MGAGASSPFDAVRLGLTTQAERGTMDVVGDRFVVPDDGENMLLFVNWKSWVETGVAFSVVDLNRNGKTVFMSTGATADDKRHITDPDGRVGSCGKRTRQCCVRSQTSSSAAWMFLFRPDFVAC